MSMARAYLSVCLLVAVSTGCEQPWNPSLAAPADHPTAPTSADDTSRPTPGGLAGLYPQSSLVPSRLAECARYRRAVADELSRHLRALPTVHAVSAVLDIPACDPLRAARGDAPTASLVVTLAGVDAARVPDRPGLRRDIAALAAAAVAELRPERVAVVLADAPVLARTEIRVQPTPMASVGPIAVAAESRRPLLILLALLFGLILALAIWALFGERLNIALRSRLRLLEASIAAPDERSADEPPARA
jgi:type III secretory pathway lipoprotein EscJ